jgi:hypothetical protein
VRCWPERASAVSAPPLNQEEMPLYSVVHWLEMPRTDAALMPVGAGG